VVWLGIAVSDQVGAWLLISIATLAMLTSDG
jgi:hypothetical protein